MPYAIVDTLTITNICTDMVLTNHPSYILTDLLADNLKSYTKHPVSKIEMPLLYDY